MSKHKYGPKHAKFVVLTVKDEFWIPSDAKLSLLHNDGQTITRQLTYRRIKEKAGDGLEIAHAACYRR